MASSEEGFEMLRTWKKSQTVLSITFLPAESHRSFGMSRNGDVLHLDERKGLVILGVERDGFRLDLSDADFVVGADKKSLHIRLSDGERWLLVERRLD